MSTEDGGRDLISQMLASRFPDQYRFFHIIFESTGLMSSFVVHSSFRSCCWLGNTIIIMDGLEDIRDSNAFVQDTSYFKR